MFPENIFDFITQQENGYETNKIQVGDNWYWNMRDHIQLLFHLKNGVFYTGDNNWLRAFKEVMAPIIELANWTEDLEVKDVTFFIEDKEKRHLSFLIKKYHEEIYTKEHDLDELFDEITEHDNTYGGVLIDTSQKKERPKAIPFTRIAFCDQTDILSSPLGFKLFLSPAKLRSMAKNGWGKKENGAEGTVEDLIKASDFSKDAEGTKKGNNKNIAPGKSIEVYMVFGELPKRYLNDTEDSEETTPQIQIVAAYYDKDKNRQGFTLYKKAGESNLKFFTSQIVEGRGLGRGVGEKMIHPQIWTNFLEIHKTKLLEAGSKIIPFTDDEALVARQKITDLENLEWLNLAENKRIGVVPTMAGGNIQIMQGAINTWFEHAQFLGNAQDPLIGKEASSGTTFRGQERLVMQGKGSHDRKRGKRAKFIEALYRETIIPQIVSEIVNGKEFLTSLSAEEMTWVMERMAENYAIKQRNEDVLNGELPRDEELLKEEFKTDFKKENRKPINILKDEFRGIDIGLGINIAGKQKDLRGLADKMLSIFQFIFSNPPAFQQALQVPGMSKAFYDILEYSGIDSANFMATVQKLPIPQEQTAPTSEGQLLPTNQANEAVTV